MLESLLQYHRELAGCEFVRRIMARVERASRTRLRVLGVAAVTGLVFAGIGASLLLPELTGTLSFQLDFGWLDSLAIAGGLAALVWIFNDEFEGI